MNVSGFTWAGVLARDFEASVAFFRDVMGFALERRAEGPPTVAMFRMPSGQIFEVFGPGDAWRDANWDAPVLGFDVPDIEAARAVLEAQGVEFLTGIFTWEAGDKWMFFRGPEGHIYEIWQRVGS